MYHSRGRAKSLAICHPYSYRVYLPGIHTWAQLAPTRRCAILKFTFPKTSVARIVVSAGDATTTTRHDGHEVEIVGHVMRNVGGVPTNFACRFVARFDASPAASKLLGAKGQYVGVALTFNAQQSRVVRMRVGTSFISVNQARVNLKREIPGWSLRAVSGQARSVWNRLLGKIDIGGATAAQKTIFYTCLYRALLFPHSFYEVSARSQRIHYSPVTGKIYSGRLYTDTDFWDIAFCFSSFVAGVSTAGWADHSWFSKFL
ncbi:MAG: glycoside hydrolase domain-containing protein [Phycisphaerae bacterium]